VPAARSARGAAGFRFALIEDEELFWIEILDAVSPGTEVVEQNDVRNVQLLRKDGSVDRPGKIRRANAIVDDGARDAESSGENFFTGEMRGRLAREFLAIKSN